MSVNGITETEPKTAADFQQLADDIESLLASPAGVDPASVVRLHLKFEQAAKSINIRLRDCDQLLKKGLRNEALERCETEPNLLDLFLILDFPERESWNETVLQCGLHPTDLLVGVAADLHDAMVAEKPLADLKYQNRLHALARSPLPIRIRLMRKLARADQDTTLWEDDLRIFERTRHNQLSKEIQTAIASGNAAALHSLHDELQSPDWLLPPAKVLLKQVTEALAVQHRQQARQELKNLEPELVAAFAAFDVERGRMLRQSWRQTAQEAALPASDPLLQQVAPALQWLQDQDQQEREQAAYEQAVAALSQALDRGAGRLTLEEKYHSLMALDRGIPDDLRQRLEERLQRLDRDKTRALQLRIAAGAVLVSLLVGIAIFMIRQSSFQNQVQAQAAMLRKLLDEKQLAETQAHLSKLDAEFPEISRTASIQQIRNDLAVALEQDARRQVELNALLQTARNDGLEHATLQTIPSALQTLSKAWDIAIESSEKTRVKDLTKSIEEHQAELQQTTDEQFSSELAKKRSEFAVLKAAPLDHLADLQLLRNDTRTLLDRNGVSSDVRDTKGLPLMAELDQAIQQGLKLQSEARFLKEIDAGIGDRAKFFAQLEKYSSAPEFVGTLRSNEFATAMRTDSALVAGYQNWSTFLESLMRRDVTSLDSATAARLKSDGEKLIKDHPGFPYSAQLQSILGYLGKTAARERGSPVMDQLLALKVFKLLAARADGKRYYLASEPLSKDSKGGQMIRYYTDTEFKATKQERLLNVDSEPGWCSPQMQFELEAGDLLVKLRDQKGANWDPTFIELLGRLYNSTHMDPILKIQLLPHILLASADGSSFLPKRLEKIKTEIDRENLNPSANWVAPDDSEANQVRVRAEVLLKRMAGDLHDVKPLLAEADQFLQSLKRPRFDVRYVWTAWLHRDHENKWTCKFRGNAPLVPIKSDLYILQRSEAGEITFARIGQCHQGQIKIDSTVTDLHEGKPVYEKKPEPE